MEYAEIKKPDLSQLAVTPNITDAAVLGADYDWTLMERELGITDPSQLNLARLAFDRHAASPRADRVALFWEGKNGEEERFTFAEMAALTDRFANALADIGVRKGDRVFFYMERVPELYVAFFGTLKLGAIAGPLFADFGPDPVRDRLEDSGARVFVTTPALKSRVEGILGSLPELKHLIIIDRAGEYHVQPGEYDYQALMDATAADFSGEPVGGDDYSLMHYTSGTTGKPKGAVHRHYAGLQHYATGKWVLDFHDDDIYWCTADPGWVTGTSYGMFAPWLNGVSQVIYEGGFRASHWYSIIAKYKVTVWYTAPTAIRMLMKAGDDVVAKHDLSTLRHICSVGEPLNPEAVVWGVKVFGQAIHDNWWQTETGAIMIANYAFMPVRPGSMGRPIPGVRPGIIDEDWNELPAGIEGNLALRQGWPAMLRGYWNNEEMYNSRFREGWYITGDRAYQDTDGYFWFVGRADDVINTAGHLVGPFEVESALMEHPAVAEAGVIGKPDPLAMEVVKAFVALHEGYEPTPELRRELIQFSRKKLAAATAPRDIEFVKSLPKTRSGKIMRRVLKAQELGLPLGDTSTLEDYD